MLELRLHSGQIVSFDGRILEIFAPDGASERLHIANIDATCDVDADGSCVVGVADSRLEFTPDEATPAARLLAAIADARHADGQLDTRARR